MNTASGKGAGNLDFLDPTTWATQIPSGPRRIYLSDTDDSLFVLIDPDDYEWASQWLWAPKKDKHGRKHYAYRTKTQRSGGVKASASIFLHKEVLERAGAKPPTEKHTIGDHRNGDSLDCRKINLRWATPSMNRRNINGCHPHDLTEAAYG